MLPLKSGKEVRLAMTAGQIDVGTGSFTNFMAAIAEGAPIRFIATLGSSPTYIFVRPDGKTNKFTDLYGKNVAAKASGINGLVFQMAMQKENIDISKMQFAEIEKSYQIIALMEKKVVDAVVVAEQDVEMLSKAGAIILPEWESKRYSQDSQPRNQLAINKNFLDQNEDIARDFLEAYVDANRLISENPQEAAKILTSSIKKQTNGAIDHSPEKLSQQWRDKEIVNTIWQDPAITMELIKKAKEIGALEKDLALDEVYDLRFKDMLQAAQNEIYGQTR